MSDNVVPFPGSESWPVEFSTVEEIEPPHEAIYDAAQASIKDNLIIIGRDEEDGIYFASSSRDVSKINLLLDLCKKMILDAVE